MLDTEVDTPHSLLDPIGQGGDELERGWSR